MRTPGLKKKISAGLVLAGMRQEDLAACLGISRTTLQRRLGDPDKLTRFELKKIHQYLGISYEELMT